MSEYQYYEFQAIDQSLTDRQMQELRAVSTRATITRSSFQNSYDFGDFKGDPWRIMEKYFDAHLYVANWGSHRFMLRVPESLVSAETISLYASERHESFSFRSFGKSIVLDFDSETEEPEDWDRDDDFLPSLIPVRADLLMGDSRSLYLGWLLRVQNGEIKETRAEPPVPAGLRQLNASLESLTRYLRLDRNLLEAAAMASPDHGLSSPPERVTKDLLRSLPEKERMDWLERLLEDPGPNARIELLRKLQEKNSRKNGESSPAKKRTIQEILLAAENIATQRQQKESELAEIRRRKEKKAREKYIQGLSSEKDALWVQADELAARKRPQDYDAAIRLLKDLRELGFQSHQMADFESRLRELRSRHQRKFGFISRLNEAGLSTDR